MLLIQLLKTYVCCIVHTTYAVFSICTQQSSLIVALSSLGHAGMRVSPVQHHPGPALPRNACYQPESSHQLQACCTRILWRCSCGGAAQVQGRWVAQTGRYHQGVRRLREGSGGLVRVPLVCCCSTDADIVCASGSQGYPLR